MSASDTPENRPVTDSRESISARLPASEETQLSAPNGVSINVSSVAIDRGLLNFAGSSPSARDNMANSIGSSGEAVSDVDVMLRVKTGDETAFAYLVQKYRRQLVGFMYRLCHNPATAEELAQAWRQVLERIAAALRSLVALGMGCYGDVDHRRGDLGGYGFHGAVERGERRDAIVVERLIVGGCRADAAVADKERGAEGEGAHKGSRNGELLRGRY